MKGGQAIKIGEVFQANVRHFGVEQEERGQPFQCREFLHARVRHLDAEARD